MEHSVLPSYIAPQGLVYMLPSNKVIEILMPTMFLDHCHIHANSNTSPICSDASPISSDVSPINSDVSPPNSYSVPPVRPARFCHTFRYIPCFLPVTYLSPCCYLLLPCVYPFSCASSSHVFLLLGLSHVLCLSQGSCPFS